MAHKGIREWTGEEAGNLFLGQNGFHLIKGTSEVLASDKGIEYWVAFKAIDGTAGLKANSVVGDDLSTTGDYSGAVVHLSDGDIVYGAFDKITMDETTEYILAYIGK